MRVGPPNGRRAGSILQEDADVDMSGRLCAEFEGACRGCRCVLEAWGEYDRDLFREADSCPFAEDCGLHALLVVYSSCKAMLVVTDFGVFMVLT